MALRPIKRKPLKRKFLTYDLEWLPETLELRLLGLYDGASYKYFETVDSFLNAVLIPRYANHWFYAHAGGLYDFQFLLDSLVKKGWLCEAAFSGSSAIIVKVTDGERRWFFIDSYWLLRQPLAEIGKWLDMEKGDCAFDAPLSELIEYNAQDCRILWHAIEYFETFLLESGGQLEKTIAASALGLFKRKYLSRVVNTNAIANERARIAYIGSRVEVIQTECGNALDWDINSSFPHSMTFPLPCEPIGVSRRIPKTDKFLVEATIHVPDSMNLPPLPYRSTENRIYFPVGKWRSWFTDIDFHLAEELGVRIEKIHRAIGFTTFDDLGQYAIDIYEKRRRATSAGEKYVLKILLNSLYGKFGERSLKEKLVINPTNHWLKNADKNRLSMLSPGIFLYAEDVPVPHEHVAIAADITARSRQSLLRYMLKCREVYYCDTDGFACSPKDMFPSGDGLGELKLVAQFEKGIHIAPKLYAHKHKDGWHIKAKGFSKIKGDDGLSRKISYDDFIGLLEHKEVPLETFARLKTTARKGELSSGVMPKTWRGVVRPKRAPTSNGKTRPWNVEEIVK